MSFFQNVFMLFVVGMVLYGIYMSYQKKSTEKQRITSSFSWPSTIGTVTETPKLINPYKKYETASQWVEIHYSYMVNGSRYDRGTRLVSVKDSKTVAAQYLEKYPTGTTFTVYYNPEIPEESLMEDERKNTSGVPQYILVLAVIVAIGLTIFLFTSFHK